MSLTRRLQACARPVLFAAGVAIAIGYLLLAHDLERRTSCQAGYNEAFTGQLLARAAVTDSATRAQVRGDAAVDTLLNGFAKLAATVPADQTRAEKRATDEKSRALFTRYTRLRERAKTAQLAAVQARAAHPLPPIPDC